MNRGPHDNNNDKVAGVADPAIIEAALRIILQPGQVTELRCLDATTRKIVGRILKAAISTMRQSWPKRQLEFNRQRVSISLSTRLNPSCWPGRLINAAPLAVDPTTGDADILQRNWLLIDCDAKRPSGVSASDAEHEASLEKALSVRDDLLARGWPMPILADRWKWGTFALSG